jgi:hypothetical protein
MQRHTTLYLYELAWMLPSVAIPVGMLAALAVTAFGRPYRFARGGWTCEPRHRDADGAV